MNQNVEAQINITSLLGNTISNQSLLLENGVNQINYNLENTGNGVYLLQLLINNKQLTKKIIINK